MPVHACFMREHEARQMLKAAGPSECNTGLRPECPSLFRLPPPRYSPPGTDAGPASCWSEGPAVWTSADPPTPTPPPPPPSPPPDTHLLGLMLDLLLAGLKVQLHGPQLTLLLRQLLLQVADVLVQLLGLGPLPDDGLVSRLHLQGELTVYMM